MAHRSEDIELDESYWQALMSEAEQLPIPVTRPPGMTGAHATERDGHGHAPVQAPLSYDAMWSTLERLMNSGEQMEVEVTGCNRGGLIVLYRGIRGFVPSSHVHSITPDCDETERRSNLAGNIGKKLTVRIIELDPAQERVVFSEKEHKEEEPPREIPAVLYNLNAGDTCRGTVTNLTAFGAFVDLGGYEGLVHVSELAWSRVNHPRDLLRIGQDVNVYVMSVSPDEGRIALSLKRAKQNPWEGIERRYHVGQVVRGVVTNVVQFGAFVKVEDDLEGLVHVSELADGSFLHPRNIVHEGDEVTARVISVDAGQRRLALSLRGVSE
jgi:small subunit ribosomal protein S1